MGAEQRSAAYDTLPTDLVEAYKLHTELVRFLDICGEYREQAVPERLKLSRLDLWMKDNVIGKMVRVEDVSAALPNAEDIEPPIKKFVVEHDTGIMFFDQGERRLFNHRFYTQPQIGSSYRQHVRGKVVEAAMDSGELIVRPRFFFPDDRFVVNMFDRDGETPLVDVDILSETLPG